MSWTLPYSGGQTSSIGNSIVRSDHHPAERKKERSSVPPVATSCGKKAKIERVGYPCRHRKESALFLSFFFSFFLCGQLRREEWCSWCLCSCLGSECDIPYRSWGSEVGLLMNRRCWWYQCVGNYCCALHCLFFFFFFFFRIYSVVRLCCRGLDPIPIPIPIIQHNQKSDAAPHY